MSVQAEKEKGSSFTGGLLGRVMRNRDTYMTLLLLVIITAAFMFLPRFGHPRTITFLVLDISAILLMALPMTLVMIAADIDLSVASTAGLSSAVFGVMIEGGIPLVLACVICLAIGVACGAFNGLMSAYVGLPALAVTIGTLALYRGLALVVIGEHAIAKFPAEATALTTGTFGKTGIPFIAVLLVVFIVIFAWLLHWSPWGRQLFALGYSSEAARFVGIDTRKTRATALVISGAMAALAGIYWTLRYSSARADSAEGLELTVIAAVVFGGVSVFGGKGSIWGSVCGVLTVGVITTALRQNRVPDYILVMITGLLLIVSVVGPSLVDAWKQWRHRSEIAAKAAKSPSRPEKVRA
ncbi:MAG: ABC transporter permease [Actinomycetaceae bacterium]|nr:ABC transporter permease [Actinomycetaceae bacterium]